MLAYQFCNTVRHHRNTGSPICLLILEQMNVSGSLTPDVAKVHEMDLYLAKVSFSNSPSKVWQHMVHLEQHMEKLYYYVFNSDFVANLIWKCEHNQNYALNHKKDIY